jgi:hypothetical protein
MPSARPQRDCPKCGYPPGSHGHHVECGGSGRQGRAWIKGRTGGTDQRVALNTRMWPGIVKQLDALCTCTLAPHDGVYQVKVRDTGCRNHGGDLVLVLARMERA